jgi:hypothetical protein
LSRASWLVDRTSGSRESRLVRVRGIAAADEHAPLGIDPALDVVVYVLAAHDSHHGVLFLDEF